jgi:hypothetical protein
VKMRVPLLAVVVLVCFATPLMASPIPIGAPASPGYAMGSNVGLGFAELDVLSSSYKQDPSGFSVQGAMGDPRGADLQESMDNPRSSSLQESMDNSLPAAGSVGAIGRDGHPDPGPNAVRPAVSEPSGLMVMLGSGLFGAGALLRRRLKA